MEAEMNIKYPKRYIFDESSYFMVSGGVVMIVMLITKNRPHTILRLFIVILKS
jgi:hypothetical protein